MAYFYIPDGLIVPLFLLQYISFRGYLFVHAVQAVRKTASLNEVRHLMLAETEQEI